MLVSPSYIVSTLCRNPKASQIAQPKPTHAIWSDHHGKGVGILDDQVDEGGSA
jgi:hypothetical protein